MSLADLIPAIQKTRMERPEPEPNAAFKRWRNRNRAQWNAYRRAWYAKRQKVSA